MGADGPINGVSRSHGGDGGAIGNGVQPPCAQPSGGPTIRWCRSRVLFAPVSDLHQRCGGRAGWRTHQRASYWDSGPVRRITAAPRGGGPCYLNDRVHSTIRAALQLLSAPSDDPGLIPQGCLAACPWLERGSASESRRAFPRIRVEERTLRPSMSLLLPSLLAERFRREQVTYLGRSRGAFWIRCGSNPTRRASPVRRVPRPSTSSQSNYRK